MEQIEQMLGGGSLKNEMRHWGTTEILIEDIQYRHEMLQPNKWDLLFSVKVPFKHTQPSQRLNITRCTDVTRIAPFKTFQSSKKKQKEVLPSSSHQNFTQLKHSISMV